MLRACGIGFGIVTHALFLYTVYHLFRFLHADTAVTPPGSLWIDLALAGEFSVVHSLLLYPKIRQRLTRWIPRPFYGCFFCIVSCLTLLGTFAGWRSAEPVIWRLTGWAEVVVESAFYASWVALIYSLYLSGLGYQTGFTPWWSWFRGRPLPDRQFQPRSLFLLFRHPVYMCFLGLIWFNPIMTLDRLLLALLWSGYIFLGSYLKDERMAHFLGEAYRDYQQRVPGFSLLLFSSLARLKTPRTES